MSDAGGVRGALTKLSHLRLLTGDPHRLAYLGWVGRGNMGDEALLDVARRAMPDVTVTPWPEGRLGTTLLRAPRRRHFDAALLGGGTLIGTPRFRESLEAMAARQPDAPLSMVGAGVEDPEHAAAGSGQAISEELDRWVPLLRRFAHVSVRGPRSQRLLADRGVDARLVGDPALLLGRWIPHAPQEERVLGVNLIGWGNVFGGRFDAVTAAVSELCRTLMAEGWRIRLIPMWERDLEQHRAVQRELGGAAELFTEIEDLDALTRAFGECRVVVGAKLHAVILAAAVGVPSIALAYSPKCLDFQESVDQGDLAFRTDGLDAAELRDAVAMLDEDHAERRRRLDTCVADLQERIAAEYAAIGAGVQRR